VIEELLPATAVCAEAYDDPPRGALFPEEAALAADWGAKRRREFTTGRLCARQALRRLGVPPEPLLRGAGGAPRWPSGVVGSITHCAGYLAVGVARRRQVAAIGIDAERAAPLPEGVKEFICLEEERAQVDDLTNHTAAVHWDRLLFSAKESAYKAWFSLTGRRLGFPDAAVTIDPDHGALSVRLRGAVLHGRWRAAGGLILTSVTVTGPVYMV
jgi:4'-phosphopantetheinyl transferase EntD